jgi:hypothetical protein
MKIAEHIKCILWYLNNYREKFHSRSAFIFSTSGEGVLLKKFLWVGKRMSESSTCDTDFYQQGIEKLCLSYWEGPCDKMVR